MTAMDELIEIHPGDPGYEDKRPLMEILGEINKITAQLGYCDHRVIQEDLCTIMERYNQIDEDRRAENDI